MTVMTPTAPTDSGRSSRRVDAPCVDPGAMNCRCTGSSATAGSFDSINRRGLESGDSIQPKPVLVLNVVLAHSGTHNDADDDVESVMQQPPSPAPGPSLPLLSVPAPAPAPTLLRANASPSMHSPPQRAAAIESAALLDTATVAQRRAENVEFTTAVMLATSVCGRRRVQQDRA
jgi:hypothetical protein